MIELNQVKNYLRIDDDCTDDDAMIEAFIMTANRFIASSTGKSYIEGRSEIWDLCVLYLCSHWYAYRHTVGSSTTAQEVPLTVKCLLNNIEMSSAYLDAEDALFHVIAENESNTDTDTDSEGS